MVDRKLDLMEIAEQLNLGMDELLVEVENILFSGTKLNIAYYIEILDEERQDDLYDYWRNSETESIEDAITELGDEYSEEEIRLMRIKFIAEVAM
ncbi:MAG: hypothetical protein DDT42_01993 [candidate division WS2 bacterium]|uniref:RecQ-1-like helix-turn-helix domain-containing protein n=1 Tax=Psychracetigena formicireducens TaxID=2986056 RepID=A0A9E2F7Z1_PSYF1|nr:hypothetical protein [Candidatus Psychracetigena formicireducens]